MLALKKYALLGLSCFSFISCSSDAYLAGSGEESMASIVEDDVKYTDNTPHAPKSVSAEMKAPSLIAAAPTKEAKPFAPQAPGVTVSRVSVPNKLVALTFDDGPHPSLTPRLLDILSRTGAKATFFVLGQNVNRYPDIVRRADADGHEIASHSYSHVNMNLCGQAKVFSELDSTAAAIQKATGKTPTLLRPPYGNMKTDMRSRVNAKYGYHIVIWDVDPLDWRKPGSAVVAQRLVKGTRPGSILLAHDIHASTVDAMESTITSLKAQGYRFVTVSELIAAGKAASASGVNRVPSVVQPLPKAASEVAPEAVLPATVSLTR